jgi:hypothetical protein
MKKKGLSVTGVMSIDCARHGLKLPLSVCDLTAGERCVSFLLS